MSEKAWRQVGGDAVVEWATQGGQGDLIASSIEVDGPRQCQGRIRGLCE